MEYKYKKLTPFKLQCLTNFPFIDEDFDALTNYGLLCKIVEYVNNIASNNNELIDNINELNNWFNNLDVQDEINNKLDEMAQSGELVEIIGQFVRLNSILIFNTLNDMIQSSNLVDGSVCKTLGFSNLNDGGDSTYYIRTITSTDIVDNSNIIALNNENLIAIRIDLNNINPELFDGLTDNEKVQNAIDYAINFYNTGVPICITLNRMFNITNTLNINKVNNRIEFTFNGNSKGGFIKNTSGLLFISNTDNNSDITFNNCVFKSTNRTGAIILNSNNFINVKFNFCNFIDYDHAIITDTYIQAVFFNGCTITGGVGHFISFKGCYGLYITNCVIEQRFNGFLVKHRFDNNYYYNRIFYLDISNNLIEGFHTENSEEKNGIIYVQSYEQINFVNNYIENIDYPIYHVNEKWGGLFVIENNRLYQGDRIENKNEKGLLYLAKYYDTKYIRMGSIKVKNNTVYNVYVIYTNTDEIVGVNESFLNLLYYGNNKVINTFNSTYFYNDRQDNAHFNILPVLLLDGVYDSKYQRKQWVFDESLTWNNTIVKDGSNYKTYYKLLNGILNLTFETDQSFTSSPSTIYYYLGVDIYGDDIMSIYPMLRDVKLVTAFRVGSKNNKYLLMQIQSNDSTTRTALITGSISLIGQRG